MNCFLLFRSYWCIDICSDDLVLNYSVILFITVSYDYITSGLGVAINLVMGCTLHQHGHSHGGNNHEHSHSAQNDDAENQPLLSHSHAGHAHDDVENINVRAGRSILYIFL